MENVTAYSFGVAAKWQAGGSIRKELMISYELNQGRAETRYTKDDNSTHVFFTIPAMRPKTKFTVRFRLCLWYNRDVCTDFSKNQTVWTKPAGKAFSIWERSTFGIPSGQ